MDGILGSRLVLCNSLPLLARPAWSSKSGRYRPEAVPVGQHAQHSVWSGAVTRRRPPTKTSSFLRRADQSSLVDQRLRRLRRLELSRGVGPGRSQAGWAGWMFLSRAKCVRRRARELALAPQQLRRLQREAKELGAGATLRSGGQLLRVVQYQYTQGHGRQLGNVHVGPATRGPACGVQQCMQACTLLHACVPHGAACTCIGAGGPGASWCRPGACVCMPPPAPGGLQAEFDCALQLELQDLRTGARSQERRRPYDMLEVVRLEPRPVTYLYQQSGPRLCGWLGLLRPGLGSEADRPCRRAGEQLEVMAEETFEQLSVPASLFGRRAALLKEGCRLLLLYADDEPVAGAPPLWGTPGRHAWQLHTPAGCCVWTLPHVHSHPWGRLRARAPACEA